MNAAGANGAATPVKDRLRLVSHFPGRLRVRAQTFRVLPEVGEDVAQRIAEETGVLGTSVSPVTGSLLVTYDPRTLQLPRLIALMIRMGGLHGLEVDSPEAWMHSPSDGARVREAFAKANDAVRGMSRGKVDMKVVLPGALAGTGLLMFVAGNRRVPEWYDLLFWGFMTFLNLNPREGDLVSLRARPGAPGDVGNEGRAGSDGNDDGERASR